MSKTELVFSFGKNWQNFLATLDESKIGYAEESLKRMLKLTNLQGMRFLDAGCGSGLFSLAALRLGAKEVLSFDIDEESVACAKHLQKTYGPFAQWEITTGSVLDSSFMKDLGEFDIVYSWGVLHHTGNMWNALENITIPTSPHGLLFISIYNNQGAISTLWNWIKYLYNVSPKFLQLLMSSNLYLVVLMIKCGKGILQLKPPSKWFSYEKDRGMGIWIDVVDWIGGYPFETATFKEIIDFYEKHSFSLTNSLKKNGSGCNEFVFKT